MAKSAVGPADLGVGPARFWWRMHPRLGLAVRTAVAAGIAWTLALMIPDDNAAQYASLAPLGAVIVTSTTVVSTAKELGRSTLALAIGGLLGMLAVLSGEPNVVTVLLVTALSVLISGWSVVGSAGTWIPSVALFTMLLGRSDPVGYISVYAGLIALGAAVGAAVVALVPQLIITPVVDATQKLWLQIIKHLEEIADDLEGDEGIRTARVELAAARERLDGQLRRLREADRLNRRRGHRDQVTARLSRGESVDLLGERVAGLTRQLADLQDEEGLQGRPMLNGLLAEAVRLVAGALHQGKDDDLAEPYADVLTQLDEQVNGLPPEHPGRHAVTATINDLRRLGVTAGTAIRQTTRSSTEKPA